MVEQLTWVIALSRNTSLVYFPGWKKNQKQQPAGVDRCVGAFFLGYIRGLFFRNSHTGLVPRKHVCVVHLSAQPLAPRARRLSFALCRRAVATCVPDYLSAAPESAAGGGGDPMGAPGNVPAGANRGPFTAAQSVRRRPEYLSCGLN